MGMRPQPKSGAPGNWSRKRTAPGSWPLNLRGHKMRRSRICGRGTWLGLRGQQHGCTRVPCGCTEGAKHPAALHWCCSHRRQCVSGIPPGHPPGPLAWPNNTPRCRCWGGESGDGMPWKHMLTHDPGVDRMDKSCDISSCIE